MNAPHNDPLQWLTMIVSLGKKWPKLLKHLADATIDMDVDTSGLMISPIRARAESQSQPALCEPNNQMSTSARRVVVVLTLLPF